MLKEEKIFVQIGTNNGMDEFNTLVKILNPTKIILVEPCTKFNDIIWENYKGIENVFLENVAITEKAFGVVKLVHPTNDNLSERASGLYFGDETFSLLPLDDWGDKFDVIWAQSMTFNDLCNKYGINDIDFLQIDTEGYDAEIIKSIDFDKIKIKIIKYESWSFGEECFTRHGENKKKYGVNGMRDVAVLLGSLGYKLTGNSHDIIAKKI